MGLPLTDIPAFQRDPLALISGRAASAEPGFVPLNLGFRPIWLASDPELARAVLKWRPAEVDKGQLVQKLRPIVGESLLTNIGDEHNRTKMAMHRHVQRNAVVANMEGMLAAINTCVARVAADGVYRSDDESAPLALQLGCIALFGHEAISAADRVALISAVRVVEAELASDMFRILPAMPWQTRDRGRKLAEARGVVDEVVARVRRTKEASPVMASLEAAGLTDEQISTEILGLLIAGHHTTGATISWMVNYLARDPSVADMIALEADDVLGAIEEGDATALREASLSLAYVKEILRLYPAGWWTSRECLEDVTIGEKRFRAGDIVMISPWQLHRDPRFWDEPDAFKLDRDFSGGAYMPFGVGPRSCIGQSIAWFELQLVVLQFAAAFTFEAPEDAPTKPHPSVTLLAPACTFAALPRRQGTFRERQDVA